MPCPQAGEQGGSDKFCFAHQDRKKVEDQGLKFQDLFDHQRKGKTK